MTTTLQARIAKIILATALAVSFAIILIGNTTYASGAQQLDVPNGNASLNWSGYVAQNSSNYTSVTGTWIVPAVSATTTGTADAAWVGIGGVQSRDLIQAGTQAIVQDGSVSYSAWIETLPGFSKSVSLAVHSGDSVTVTLTQITAGMWNVTMQNNTQGTSFSTTVAYSSSLSSAEWIEEMVSNADGSFRPLDSFGTIDFSNASATVNGTSENLSQLGAEPLTMVNSNSQTLATSSGIGADNASFSVSRSTNPAITESDSTRQMTVTVIRTRRAYRHSSHTSSIGLPAGFTFSIVRL